MWKTKVLVFLFYLAQNVDGQCQSNQTIQVVLKTTIEEACHQQVRIQHIFLNIY